jgi:hypothetical protein
MPDTPVAPKAKGWSAPPIGSPDGMVRFHDGLPVRLIATPREEFRTCRTDEPLAQVLERNIEGFDYFPVTAHGAGGDERIVGLVNLIPFLKREEPAAGLAGERMQPLSEDNLIGADASILAFVRGADHHGCRLIVSGAKVTGLVSLSDLQKLPVRAALFAIITHAEMTMADAIRREFGSTDGWMERLSDGRKAKIQTEFDQAESDDNVVDRLLFTQFVDKVILLKKSPSFTASKTRFEADMQTAQDLRNKLAHANDYAASRDAAAQVCATVRMIEHWIAQLSAWPASASTAAGGH